MTISVTTTPSKTLYPGLSRLVSDISIAGVSASTSKITVTVSDHNGLLTAFAAKEINLTGNNSTSLTFSGTLSQVNTALGTLVYKNQAIGTDTLTISAMDGGTKLTASGTQSLNIINPLTLGGLSAVKSLFQGASQSVAGIMIVDPVVGYSMITVTVSDNNGLLNASPNQYVSLTGGNSTKLSLSGYLSEVNAALQTLTYKGQTIGDDTLTISAIDEETKLTASGTQPLNIINPLTLKGLSAVKSVFQGPSQNVAGMSIVDPVAGKSTITVTVSDNNALLNVGTIKGVSMTGGNSTKLTLSGLLANVNNALGALTYQSQTIGPDTLTISVIDGGTILTASGTQSLNIINPLTLGGIAGEISTNDLLTNNPFSTLTVNNGISNNNVSATISFAAGNGKLSGLNSISLSSGVINNGIITYSLFPVSTTKLQLELQMLVFTPTAHQVQPGEIVTTNFILSVTDQGAKNYGAIVSDSNTTVNVTAVVAPTINTGSPTQAAIGIKHNISGLSISDVSADQSNITVTVSDNNGLLDTNAAKGLAITGSMSTSLTLTGTLAVVNAALGSLTVTNTTVGSDNLKITVTDVGTSIKASASQAVSTGYVALNGFSNTTTNNHFSVKPFNAVTVADGIKNDHPSATISFVSKNGTLTGAGLSSAVYDNAMNYDQRTATYTLTAANTQTLQNELQSLIFKPTFYQQVDINQSVSTSFSLTVKTDVFTPVTIIPYVNSQGFQYHNVSDSAGNIYLSNTDFSGVKEYSASGTLIKTFTLPNTRYILNSFAVDKSGNLWVSSFAEGKPNFKGEVMTKLYEFSSNGTLKNTLNNVYGDMGSQVSTYSTNGQPVIGVNGSDLKFYDSNGKLTWTYRGWTDTNNGMYNEHIQSYCVDKSGNVYLGEYGEKSFIVEWVKGGSIVTPNIFEVHPGKNSWFSAMITDNLGNLYVADGAQNHILVFSPSNQRIKTINTDAVPISLAFDSSENLYVGCSDGFKSSIKVYAPSGQLIESFNNSGMPRVLAFDGAGNLWVNNAKFAGITPGIGGSYVNTSTVIKTFQVDDVSIKVAGAQAVTQGQAQKISGITITDASAAASTVIVIATDKTGLLSVTPGQGLVVDGNNSTNLKLSGTLAVVNAALSTLTDVNGTFGRDDIQFTVTDSGTNVTGAGTQAVTVNVFPTVMTGNTQNLVSGISQTLTGISIADLSAGNSNITVTVSDQEGILKVNSGTGLTLQGNNSTSLTLTGSLTVVNKALATLVDTNSTVGVANLAITVVDSGTNFSGSGTQKITVNAPEVMLSNIHNLWVTGSQGITGLSIKDLSAGSSIISVTITDKTGILSVAPLQGLTLAGNNSTSVTLSGLLSVVNSALEALTVANNSLGTDNLTISVTDPGTHLAGSGSQLLTITHPISLSGSNSNITLNDTVTVKPFSRVNVFDDIKDHNVSAAISFNQQNGVLSGNGLSSGVLASDTITYTLSATSPSTLQSELRDLVFTPTAHQTGGGSVVTTGLTLTLADVNNNLTPLQTLSSGISNPASASVDSSGNIYVSNTGNNSVEKFSSTGQLLWTVSTGSDHVYNITTDAVGNMYAAIGNVTQNTTYDPWDFLHWNPHTTTYKNSAVREYSPEGNLLKTVVSDSNSDQPYSLATDSQGNVFVGNSNTNNVQEFSSSGTLIQTITNGVNSPSAVSFDSDGNIYIANSGNNTVEKFSSSGSLLNTLSTGVSSPVALALDSQGNVYVANSGNSTVQEFSSSGSLLNTLSMGINKPSSVLIDSAGDVYVANSGNNTVVEFSPSGSLMRTLSNGVSAPVALTKNNVDEVYVINSGNNTVEKFAPYFYTEGATLVNASTLVKVTATAQTFTENGGSLAAPLIVSGAHSGDTLIINDGTSFNAASVSAANVTAAGGDVNTLAGWISGAFNSHGANLATHGEAWFNFSGNTYVVEQANSQGSDFSSGDTLVQLVGVFNESTSQFAGHTLTL